MCVHACLSHTLSVVHVHVLCAAAAQGGVDPRLWSAIVASYTYSLPSYTFDLSPWLPQLNSLPSPFSSSGGSTAAATASSSSSAASQVNAGVDGSSSEVRMPSTPHQQPAASRRLTQQQQQQEAQALSDHHAATQAASGHTITVELGGATGERWMMANTLLLWRAVGPDGEPQRVTAAAAAPQDTTGTLQQQQQPQGKQRQEQQQEREGVEVVTSPGFDAPMESHCVPVKGGDLAVAGKCTLQVQDRWLRASSQLQWEGHTWTASVEYVTSAYDNVITFSNDANVTDGALTWYQETHHKASWSLAVQQPSGQQQQQPKEQQQQSEPASAAGAAAAVSHVLTQSSVQYDWLNGGVVAAGGPFEYSFNATLLQPTVFAAVSTIATAAAGGAGPGGQDGVNAQQGGSSSSGVVVGTGRQRHYQRAIMLNVYTPQSPRCEVPVNATHTVSLHSSISSGQVPAEAGGGDSSCVRRWGTCGFCAARLMSNEVEWDVATGC